MSYRSNIPNNTTYQITALQNQILAKPTIYTPNVNDAAAAG